MATALHIFAASDDEGDFARFTREEVALVANADFNGENEEDLIEDSDES